MNINFFSSEPVSAAALPDLLLTTEDEPLSNLVVQKALSQCALLEEGDSIIGAVLLEEEEEEEEAEADGTQEDLFDDLPQLDGTSDESPRKCTEF